MYNQGVIYNQHSLWGPFGGIRTCDHQSLKKRQEHRRQKLKVWRRRQWSPQRCVRPPPWGAGGLLTWTGWLRDRTEEEEEGGLHSQAEALSQHVFDQHVWVSLQKMDAGTEAEVGVWAGSLEVGRLSVLLLLWYRLQTERDDIHMWAVVLIFIHLEAVDCLKNHTGGFIRFSPLTSPILHKAAKHFQSIVFGGVSHASTAWKSTSIGKLSQPIFHLCYVLPKLCNNHMLIQLWEGLYLKLWHLKPASQPPTATCKWKRLWNSHRSFLDTFWLPFVALWVWFSNSLAHEYKASI